MRTSKPFRPSSAKVRVRFSPLAQEDLDLIHRYVSEDSPRAADQLVTRILTLIEMLESFPLLGYEGRIADTRELPVPGVPYFAVYTIPDQYHVDIERVLHASREYPCPTPD